MNIKLGSNIHKIVIKKLNEYISIELIIYYSYRY